MHLRNTNKRNFTILNSVSGVIKPGVFTLLLGPPGSGKTTLLTALAGKLQGVGGVKVRGPELPNLCYSFAMLDKPLPHPAGCLGCQAARGLQSVPENPQGQGPCNPEG